MFDFVSIGGGYYSLYQNGVRVSDVPLTKDELCDAIFALPLSAVDQAAIEYFC